MKISLRTTAMMLLVVIGMIQIAGYAAGIPSIRGAGFLTVASPLPLVFSHFRGYETFALDFEIELESVNGDKFRKTVTPELYSKLSGPYNRRNVYGAVFAYGPGFNSEGELRLRDSVLRYGFCRPGVLLDEFDLPGPAKKVTAFLKSRTKGDNRTWTFSVDCAR